MNKQKYLIIVGDGMADYPIDKLGGKTPLEYASTPNMDKIASAGHVGLLSTIPDGFIPGSDIGNMSLLGYDPRRYFSGRAPIEAASMGVELGEDDVAFRCNLVTIANGEMEDYSAGHISTDAAHWLIGLLQKELGNSEMTFHPGVSYRHLLTIKKVGAQLTCTPPHDITGQEIRAYLPRDSGQWTVEHGHLAKHGSDAKHIVSIMDKAREVIAKAKFGGTGFAEGCLATDIWLWGQGPAAVLPSLKERYGLSGSVISAVDLVMGLGKLAGLCVRKVEGATGYLDTNYAGKVATAKAAFDGGENFVFLHIEAPDETSHEGILEKKIQAIEELDRYVVHEMLAYQSEHPELRIAVCPDHVTALSTRTHDSSPVPFCMCGPGVKVDGAKTYSEAVARNCAMIDGVVFFDTLIKGE